METFITLTNLGITRLPKTLNVSGCFAIVKRLILPVKYYNFSKSVIKYRLETSSGSVTFPAGYYPDLNSIVDMLEYIFPAEGKEIDFDCDTEQMTLTVTLKGSRSTVTLPNELSERLNLPTRLRGKTTSYAPVRMMKQFMFVNADFVTPQIVGESYKSVLYTAYEQNSIEYIRKAVPVKLSKEYIDTVNIWITEEDGTPLYFLDGSIFIQIAFVHKY